LGRGESPGRALLNSGATVPTPFFLLAGRGKKTTPTLQRAWLKLEWPGFPNKTRTGFRRGKKTNVPNPVCPNNIEGASWLLRIVPKHLPSGPPPGLAEVEEGTII
jgi:hypothetical protein